MPKTENTVLKLEFEDNRIAALVFGDLNKHLTEIERRLGTRIDQFGNQIEISGTDDRVSLTAEILTKLYSKGNVGEIIDMTIVRDALRLIEQQHSIEAPEISGRHLSTKKNVIKPRTINQGIYVEALQKHDLVFGLGPAGTGKTYLAVAVAVNYFLAGKVKKIILTRPAVEAGENLGFLPGDLKEKVDPYLRPLFDALSDMLPQDLFERMMESEQIEIAPLAFMRGRTLSNAFVILDEAQNTTPAQMKMFLTRLGDGGRMAVNGDLSQTDLPYKVKSGLLEASEFLRDIPEISFVEFTDDDVVRHPLVAKVIKAYNKNGASFSC